MTAESSSEITAAADAEQKQLDAGSQEAQPEVRRNCTLYVRNLNERIPLPMLKQALGSIFMQHGPLVDVQAWGNIRMRGQAFIVFRDEASAERGLSLNGFPLFSKNIEVAFAKQKSLKIAKMDGTAEQLKSERQEGEAEREEKFQSLAKKAKENAADGPPRPRHGGAMPPFPMMPGMPPLPPGMGPPPMMPGVRPGMPPMPPGMPPMPGMPPAGAPPAAHQIPDEMLPPNKILFVQNIPKDIDLDPLVLQFKRFPGFKENRPVPGRPDLMFVEYETEFQATPAKEMLNGKAAIPGNDALIKVTFARK